MDVLHTSTIEIKQTILGIKGKSSFGKPLKIETAITSDGDELYREVHKPEFVTHSGLCEFLLWLSGRKGDLNFLLPDDRRCVTESIVLKLVDVLNKSLDCVSESCLSEAPSFPDKPLTDHHSEQL